MNIGIIGSGNIGAALAKHFTQKGHTVLIANSRGPSSLSKIAADTGAKPATVEEAAKAHDLVVITVPEAAVPHLPREILSTTKATVIDTGNYYPVRDGQISEIDEGLMESEWVSKVIGRSVIKAFNNIGVASLIEKGTPIGAKGRIALSASGNDPLERQLVLRLIDEIGFEAVDAGPLSDSWRQQPGTPAYCQDLDAEGLKAALLQADRNLIPQYRKAADDSARPYFAK